MVLEIKISTNNSPHGKVSQRYNIIKIRNPKLSSGSRIASQRNLLGYLALAILLGSCSVNRRGVRRNAPEQSPTLSRPLLVSVNPPSPSRVSSDPILRGTIPGDGDQINFYSNSTCTASLGSASKSEFESTGVQLTLNQNSTNPIYAKTVFGALTSDCFLLTQFIHDSVAPSVASFAISNSSPTNSQSLGLQFGLASETLATYCLLENSVAVGGCSWQSMPLPAAFSASATNESKTLSLWVEDLSGNVSTIRLSNVVDLDTVAPSSLSFSSFNPGSPSPSMTPLVIGNSDADVATLTLYKDASCTLAIGSGTKASFESTGLSASVTANSVTNVRVKATDQAGNISACTFLGSYQHSLSFDPASIAIKNDDSYTNSSSVVLSISAQNASEMYITNTAGCGSGGTWVPYATTSAGWILASANQTNTVYIKFRNAFLLESACYSDSILHDSIAPTTASAPSHIGTLDNLSQSPSVTWTNDSTDAGSGISHYEYAVGTGVVGSGLEANIKTWTSVGSSPFTASGLSLSYGTQYFISLRAVDSAGNYAIAISSAGWWANRAPTISAENHYLFPLDGVQEPLIVGSLHSRSLSASDPESDSFTYNCAISTPELSSSDLAYLATSTACGTISGLTFNSGAGTLDWTPINAQIGSYQFSITATDSKGAISNPIIFDYSVRANFSTTNLLSAWSANFSRDNTDHSGLAIAPRSIGVDRSNWPALIGSAATLNPAFNSSWAGNGNSTAYSLSFAANANDSVDFGNSLAGASTGLIHAWVRPQNSSAASTLFSTGGVNGNGVALRQLATHAGKLEFRVGMDYQNIVLAKNPLIYWRMNESSGTNIDNLGSLGNAADGTYSTNYSFGAAGPLAANGGDSDNGITISNLARAGSPATTVDQNAFDGASKLTIEFWIKPSATGVDAQPRAVISKRVANLNNDAFNVFIYTGRRIDFRVNGGTDLFSGTALNANSWYHVVAVFDGTLAAASRKKIYINGVLDATGSSTSTTITATNSPIHIGTLNAAYGRSYDGVLDEVSLYDQALSLTEVSDRYRAATNSCRSTTTLSNGSWYLLSLLHDGTNSKMFINGTQECSSVYGQTYNPSTQLKFGAANTWSSYFSGELGELMIYSTGDSTAVTNFYNATLNNYP